jgi:hypothetical protein
VENDHHCRFDVLRHECERGIGRVVAEGTGALIPDAHELLQRQMPRDAPGAVGEEDRLCGGVAKRKTIVFERPGAAGLHEEVLHAWGPGRAAAFLPCLAIVAPFKLFCLFFAIDDRQFCFQPAQTLIYACKGE